MSGSKALLLRLDLALFVATASALTGYYRYQQRQPVRRASTRLHVSFGVREDFDENRAAAAASDAAVPAVVSLSLLEELHAVSSSSSKTRPILGLLFAASWCPDCHASGVVAAVGRLVVGAEHSVDIVYVSSDTSEAELLQFKPKSMRHVPFDNVELRTALKRQFRTCANREVGDVFGTHIQRRHGIPTLILLDTATGKVLTTNGVEDVMNADSPSQVLRKWKGMLEKDSGE